MFMCVSVLSWLRLLRWPGDVQNLRLRRKLLYIYIYIYIYTYIYIYVITIIVITNTSIAILLITIVILVIPLLTPVETEALLFIASVNSMMQLMLACFPWGLDYNFTDYNRTPRIPLEDNYT